MILPRFAFVSPLKLTKLPSTLTSGTRSALPLPVGSWLPAQRVWSWGAATPASSNRRRVSVVPGNWLPSGSDSPFSRTSTLSMSGNSVSV